MTKLDDKLAARDECRARFLLLRKDHASSVDMRRKLTEQCALLAEQIQREQSKLADLTAEVAQLLHADLAGVVGKLTNGTESQPPEPLPRVP